MATSECSLLIAWKVKVDLVKAWSSQVSIRLVPPTKILNERLYNGINYEQKHLPWFDLIHVIMTVQIPAVFLEWCVLIWGFD